MAVGYDMCPTILSKIFGGLIYTVTETQNITLGSNYKAEILYDELKINIRPMLRALQERSFLHEVIHAIQSNLGYTDHNEGLIDELAGALYALIVDNPVMFEKE